MVLTFCIHSTTGRGRVHEPPRWIRALVKETNNPTVTFRREGPLRTPPSVEKVLRLRSVASFAEAALPFIQQGHPPTYPSRSGGHGLTSFRGQIR